MKIYAASSWRNREFPAVVEALRAAGHDVYDFRNPGAGHDGFHWSDFDPAWRSWTPSQMRDALEQEAAVKGFESDMTALRNADACVMVQPCGRSAALELGWAAGAGKLTIALLAAGEPPELMLRMADHLCLTVEEVIACLDRVAAGD